MPWKSWSMLGTIAFAMVPFDGKYMTSYLMAIVMFALTLIIYEVYAKQNAESLALKMKVKVKEKNCKKLGSAPQSRRIIIVVKLSRKKGCFITTRHSIKLYAKLKADSNCSGNGTGRVRSTTTICMIKSESEYKMFRWSFLPHLSYCLYDANNFKILQNNWCLNEIIQQRSSFELVEHHQ